MPPSNGISRMAQYARGSSDPNISQAQNGASTYYPPASNSRDAVADSIKMPLPRPSGPPHVSVPPRHMGSATVGPPASPTTGALPNPPRGLLNRRRTNSGEHPGNGQLWAPSLPSAIATPSGSPTSTVAETQYNHQNRNRDLGGPRRATSDLATLTSGTKYMEPIQPSRAFGLGAQNAMRIGAQDNKIRPPYADTTSIGFLQSPPKPQMNLPFHDLSSRRPFPKISDLAKEEPRASSPFDDPLPPQQRGGREQGRGQQRSTYFGDDADFDIRSLRSDMPLSDEEPGTPRPLKREGRRADVFLNPGDSPPFSQTNRIVNINGKSKKRSRDTFDYDDKTLMRMSYSDLRGQPFDMDPTQAVAGPEGAVVGESLPEKLEHYQGKSGTEQKQFFAQLDLGDWERSGDWFLEQFGRVAQKLKETRQNKRAMVETFETELASREEAVRLRTENINLKLKKIKHKGEDMLADRED
ncbi:hypothetical protein ACHAQA_005352 [Verticillium albo-atrum]